MFGLPPDQNMRRREFITLVGGAAATWPLSARAQQSERVRRIGMLYSLAEDDSELVVRRAAFEQALRKLGWTNGGNIRIGYRWAQNDPELIRKFVAELVASGARCYLGLWQRCRRSNGAGDRRYSHRIPAGY